MAEYERNQDRSDDWFTPRSLLDAIGLSYDLDPCSPGLDKCHVQARRAFTKAMDGLSQPWAGRVFLNPPFGGRHKHLPWLRRFIDHGNGVGLARAYTSAGWFHDWMPRMDGILLPRGKTKFERPDGTIGKAPGHGIVVFAIGAANCAALERSGLGMYFKIDDRI